MYQETMKATTIQILHSDHSTSTFTGTKKEISEYLDYLRQEDDLLEVTNLGTTDIVIW